MKVSKKQQAAWDKKNTDRMDGHVVNNLEREGWVKDRKTGEMYNPQEATGTTNLGALLRAKLNG
jgi:hypothetical protein